MKLKSSRVIEPTIRKSLESRGRGHAFTPRDFSHIGDQRCVAMALTRLVRKGIITSLSRGIYDYPIDHPILGSISASTDSIIKLISDRDSIRIQPSGNYALNILGLSEQVPMKIVLLTDGPSRRIKLGKREIIFKHTTPRNMATAGLKSGVIIQALRALGKSRIDDKVLTILNRQINDSDRQELVANSKYAPVWIAKVLEFLAANKK